MAMIAMLSGKAAPGVTTSAALLATVWPAPVVAVDADPAGGDMAAGWLGGASGRGLMRPDRSLVSFAIETQHSDDCTPDMLNPHLQPVAGVPDCLLLAGLPDPTHLRFVERAAWRRLARALACMSKPGTSGVDVLVDCGRFGPDTPLPLLAAADLVLIAVRPRRRHELAARRLGERLCSVVEPGRLGLAVCATSEVRSMQVQRHVGLYSAIELPDDPKAALVFSDGGPRPTWFRRSHLIRSATRTAARLHDVLNTCQPVAADCDNVRTYEWTGGSS